MRLRSSYKYIPPGHALLNVTILSAAGTRSELIRCLVFPTNVFPKGRAQFRGKGGFLAQDRRHEKAGVQLVNLAF